MTAASSCSFIHIGDVCLTWAPFVLLGGFVVLMIWGFLTNWGKPK